MTTRCPALLCCLWRCCPVPAKKQRLVSPWPCSLSVYKIPSCALDSLIWLSPSAGAELNFRPVWTLCFNKQTVIFVWDKLNKVVYAEWGKPDPRVAPQGVVAWTRVRGGGGDEAGRALQFNRRTPASSSGGPTNPRPGPERKGPTEGRKMREIVHIQAGQCGNQIGTKVETGFYVMTQLLAVNNHLL